MNWKIPMLTIYFDIIRSIRKEWIESFPFALWYALPNIVGIRKEWIERCIVSNPASSTFLCIRKEWIESFFSLMETNLYAVLYQKGMNWKLECPFAIGGIVCEYQKGMNWKSCPLLSRGDSFSSVSERNELKATAVCGISISTIFSIRKEWIESGGVLSYRV